MKKEEWSSFGYWWNFFSWLTCGFGIKPLYTIRFGIAVISLFSLIYANPICWEKPDIVNDHDQNKKAHLVDLIYYSIGSFTFMSHGNWSPRDYFKIFAALEGALGWVVLGIFMAALTKTIIRI